MRLSCHGRSLLATGITQSILMYVSGSHSSQNDDVDRAAHQASLGPSTSPPSLLCRRGPPPRRSAASPARRLVRPPAAPHVAPAASARRACGKVLKMSPTSVKPPTQRSDSTCSPGQRRAYTTADRVRCFTIEECAPRDLSTSPRHSSLVSSAPSALPLAAQSPTYLNRTMRFHPLTLSSSSSIGAPPRQTST